MTTKKHWLSYLFCLFVSPIFASPHPSSQLYHQLLRFKETKRVLFVAAHPDDENTRLIAYLANAEHAEVAYMSLTRGDGGQNLLGKELGIELGYIRTHELLRARETDGGQQLFTRALDFGFSKNPDETFNNWDREELLSDVVWIIRNFQPDVIINRFNTIPGTTHGHHTSSAILSSEAFELAANEKSFPEHLSQTGLWQPKRLFWNAYNWGGQYEPQEGKTYFRFPVGEFNPLLGTTYSQIAADSRTMHKSQGFGSTSQIGQGVDFVELVKGASFSTSPFEGIESRWNKLASGAQIQAAIDKAIREFDFVQPTNNVDNLLEIKSLLSTEMSDERWFLEKVSAIDRLILQSLGFKGELVIKKEIGYPGETITADLVLNNPASRPIRVETFEGPLFKVSPARDLEGNAPLSQNIEITIPHDYPVSQPFWLENPLKGSLFGITNPARIGKPVNGATIGGTATLSMDGQQILLDLPLEYKYNDQVDGEVKQPFTLVPEVNVSLDKSNLFLIKGADTKLQVEVAFRNAFVEGNILLDGLNPNQYRIISQENDERRKRSIYLVEILNSDVLKKEVVVSFQTADGRKFNQNTRRIIYKHIPNLTYFTTTSFGLIKMDLKLSNQTIGYINGAGDEVADVLKSLGYQVNFIDDADIRKDRLKQYPTVIVGIRAFNVNQELATHVDQLMEYVKEGGNLIIQYNTSSPLLTRELGPYPFGISRERVTVENSPFEADFDHPILKGPNPVDAKDFEDWVQERGLYFTSNWDKNYTTPIAFQDPGQSFLRGSLIHAAYGEGTYTYSGISWFRHLPAGVPGAVKIFVNLIEQGGGK